MKKLICAVMAIVTAVFLTYSTDVKAGQIGTSAQCAILMDADSGEILYEKNADKKCAVASITKIMTAIRQPFLPAGSIGTAKRIHCPQ